MSSTSKPTRILLDKNIVRSALAGLRYGARRPLSTVEFGALNFWRAVEQRSPSPVLFIPFATAHILETLPDYAEVRLLLESTTALWPGPYARRWQRRIRETTGLTAEDAMILSLGTFGTNVKGEFLGVQLIVTFDQPLINGYQQHADRLQHRLHSMSAQLRSPFREVTLPRLLLPEEALIELREGA